MTVLALRLMDVAYSDLNDMIYHLITLNFALAWTEPLELQLP